MMFMNDEREEKKYLKGRKVFAIILTLVIFVTLVAVPQQSYAFSKKSKKNKVKYSVIVHNISKKTVLKKGTKLQISYTATQTKNGITSNAKVKFRSSNKRVATVSKNGVIKAKKKGTVKITVYCKKRPSKKKTIKIRVGSYTAYAHRFTAWDSKWIAHRGLHTTAIENTAAAFTAAGRTGGFWGCECDIWETRHVGYSPESLPEEPVVSNEATDNTGTDIDIDNTLGNDEAEPVDDQAAGLGNVEAVEDVEESVNNESAEETDYTAEDASLEEAVVPYDQSVDNVVDRINSLGLSSLDRLAVLDKAEEIKSVKHAYDGLDAAQKYQVRIAMQDGSGNEGLMMLFNAVAAIQEYESFDLVINHDNSYKRIFGVSSYVWDLTKDQVSVNAALNGRLCFFEDYVRICKQYGMVPVIEIKGENGHLMTEEAIKKMVDTVYKIYAQSGGESAGKAAVKNACYISFQEDSVKKTKAYIERHYGITPVTYYLINGDWGSKVDAAAIDGFTGVSVAKGLLTDSLYNRAKSYGLGVGTWTYKNTATDNGLMYDHLITGRYRLDFATVDFKVF